MRRLAGQFRHLPARRERRRHQRQPRPQQAPAIRPAPPARGRRGVGGARRPDERRARFGRAAGKRLLQDEPQRMRRVDLLAVTGGVHQDQAPARQPGQPPPLLLLAFDRQQRLLQPHAEPFQGRALARREERRRRGADGRLRGVPPQHVVYRAQQRAGGGGRARAAAARLTVAPARRGVFHLAHQALQLGPAHPLARLGGNRRGHRIGQRGALPHHQRRVRLSCGRIRRIRRRMPPRPRRHLPGVRGDLRRRQPLAAGRRRQPAFQAAPYGGAAPAVGGRQVALDHRLPARPPDARHPVQLAQQLAAQRAGQRVAGQQQVALHGARIDRIPEQLQQQGQQAAGIAAADRLRVAGGRDAGAQQRRIEQLAVFLRHHADALPGLVRADARAQPGGDQRRRRVGGLDQAVGAHQRQAAIRPRRLPAGRSRRRAAGGFDSPAAPAAGRRRRLERGLGARQVRKRAFRGAAPGARRQVGANPGTAKLQHELQLLQQRRPEPALFDELQLGDRRADRAARQLFDQRPQAVRQSGRHPVVRGQRLDPRQLGEPPAAPGQSGPGELRRRRHEQLVARRQHGPRHPEGVALPRPRVEAGAVVALLQRLLIAEHALQRRGARSRNAVSLLQHLHQPLGAGGNHPRLGAGGRQVALRRAVEFIAKDERHV